MRSSYEQQFLHSRGADATLSETLAPELSSAMSMQSRTVHLSQATDRPDRTALTRGDTQPSKGASVSPLRRNASAMGSTGGVPSVRRSGRREGTEGAQTVDEVTWRDIRAPSRRRAGTTPSKELPLSAAFMAHPSALSEGRLSLVSRRVSAIDAPPLDPTRIHTLFLSNNNISSTAGVHVFTHLTCLSLANNLVRYLDALLPLATLSTLAKLTLSGNVVTGMPNYRLVVVSTCKALTSLDGVAVSAEERILAPNTARTTMTVLHQLCANELRATLMLHLTRLGRVHAQLKRVVGGGFSSTRGEHIRGADAPEPHVGEVLRRCLFGGVFRWLQTSSSDFYRAKVQDTCQRLSVHMTRVRPQSSAALGSPPSKVSHWEGVFAEYFKQQQMELLRTADAHGGATDGLDALEMVGFLDVGAPIDKEHAADHCSVGRHPSLSTRTPAPAAPPTRPNIAALTSGRRAPPSSARSMVARSFDGPLRVVPTPHAHVAVDDLYVPPRLKSDSSSGVRGSAAAEDVAAKYNALLQQMRSGGGEGAPLPPQQRDPEDPPKRDPEDPPKRDPEDPPKRAKAKAPEGAAALADARARREYLQQGEDAGEESLHAALALLTESTWPALDEPSDAFFGVPPEAVTRVGEGRTPGNMRDMRRVGEEVEAALARRIEDLEAARSGNLALRQLADKACEVASDSAAQAARSLTESYATRNELKTEIARVRQWLSAYSTDLTRIEKEESELRALQSECAQSREAVREVEDRLVVAVRRADQLQERIREMDAGLAQQRSTLESNTELFSLAQRRRREEVAGLFYAQSIARMLCLGLSIAQWRRNTMHARRVRRYIAERRAERALRVLGVSFSALCDHMLRGRGQRRAKRLLARSCLQRHLALWCGVARANERILRFQGGLHRTKEQGVFRRLKKLVRSRRRLRRREERDAAMVTCFTVLRVFAAWKGLWRASALSLAWLPDLVAVARADAHFLARVFSVWSSSYRLHRASLSSCALRVVGERTLALKGRVLREWHSLWLATAAWRRRSLQSSLVAWAARASSLSEGRDRLLDCAHAFHRAGARNALHALSRSTSRARLLAEASSAVSLRTRTVTSRSALHIWTQATKNRVRELEQSSSALAYRMVSLCARVFRAWSSVLTRGEQVPSEGEMLLSEVLEKTNPVHAKNDLLIESDEEEDEDEEEGLGVSLFPLSDFCVLLRRALAKLFSHSRQRIRHRRVSAVIKSKSSLSLKTRCLGRLHVEWLRRLHHRLGTARKEAIVSSEGGHVTTAALQSETSELREWVQSLHGAVDDLSAQLTAQQFEVEENEQAVEAARIGLGTVVRQRDSYATDIARLREECAAVGILCSGDWSVSSAPEQSVSAVVLEAMQRERMDLLSDIEAQYGQAVATQTVCDERAAELQERTSTHLDEYAADRRQASLLLSEIALLEDERANIERSLVECQTSLSGCQYSITEKTKLVDLELEELMEEESHLLEDLTSLQAEEEDLQTQLRELRAEQRVRDGSEDLATVRADARVLVAAADARSFGRGAEESAGRTAHSARMRTVKAALPQPRKHEPSKATTKPVVRRAPSGRLSSSARPAKTDSTTVTSADDGEAEIQRLTTRVKQRLNSTAI